MKVIVQHLQKTNQKSINTLTDIGCSILCEAKIPDVTRLNVDIGLNICVEMTQPEIITFVNAKKKQLNSKVNSLEPKINKLQTDIQIVCTCIYILFINKSFLIFVLFHIFNIHFFID